MKGALRMEREEKTFVEYWFTKKNELYFRQTDGSKAFNIVKKINFLIIDSEKVACLHTLIGAPSKGERYSPKDVSQEFEIIEKADDKYVYSINVDGEALQIECDIYNVKFNKQ